MVEQRGAGRVTLVYPNMRRALSAQRAHARRGGAALGVAHTAPFALVADLWGVWGDGRVLVNAQERVLTVRALLEDHQVFAPTLGTARLLARFFARTAGLLPQAAPNIADDPRDALAPAEAAVLDLAEVYRVRLDAAGRVEASEAALLLADVVPASAVGRMELAEPATLPPAFRLLFERLGCAGLDAPPARVEPLPDGVTCGLLLPAGATAATPMIEEELSAFPAGGEAAAHGMPRTAVVLAPDPLALFATLAPELEARGVTCGVRGALPFARTQLGRALAAARKLVEGDAHWLDAATDFAYTRYAGLHPTAAEALNKRLRADRLLTCDDARELLRGQSDAFALFERLAGGASGAELASDALAALSPAIEGMPAQLRFVESAAVTVLADWYAAARATGSADADAAEAAAASSVQVSLGTGDAGTSPQVLFAPLSDMGALGADSFDLVLLADVSDGALSAASPRTALDALAEKLGLPEERPRLDELRQAFAAAESAACMRFTCVFPLRTEAQEEAYPSFLLEELAAVLAPALAEEDVEADPEETQLEALMRRIGRSFGEEHLVEGLGSCFEAPCNATRLPVPQRGVLSSLPLGSFVRTVSEEGRAVPVLSPSAIEAYLGCPYRWFVERRIGLAELDEEFGPCEFGSFAHEAFAAFFDALAARGIASLDTATWDATASLFDEVFDEVLAAQRERIGNRLAPATGAERLEVEALREQLRTSLARQAQLPPGFAVRAHEVPIVPDDGIDYAGARLNGRADRVDVNEEAKRFVVLDYKGKTAGHAAGFAENDDPDALVLPSKVQALIYAQVLRARLDGYACAGALYLGYRAKTDGDFAAGSFDPAAYDVDAFTKKSSRVEMNFDRFLDAVEEAIRPSVEALMRGEIAPAPASKQACAYCVVPCCERRSR